MTQTFGTNKSEETVDMNNWIHEQSELPELIEERKEYFELAETITTESAEIDDNLSENRSSENLNYIEDKREETQVEKRIKPLRKYKKASVDWGNFWTSVLGVLGLALFVCGAICVMFYSAIGPIIFLIAVGLELLGIFTIMSAIAISAGKYDNLGSMLMIVIGPIAMAFVGLVWGIIGLFVWLI